MGLVNLIRDINSLFPKPPIHTAEEERGRNRKIIQRYSDGQASLYLGFCTNTEEQMEVKKAKLKGYNFLEGVSKNIY